MTFRTKLLVDFADINPKHEKGTPPETPVSFVGMSDIDSESASVAREELRMFGETAKGFTQFKKGDILLAKITPCFENGKIAQATISEHLGSGSTEFHVIRAREGSADPRFLLHMLRHPKILFDGERKMTGSSGHRRVPEPYVANINIPNYPLEIQKEVRASLDTLEFLRAMRRRSIELLDELTQSIFLDMFGDPGTNSRGWPLSTIGELVDSVQYGTSQKASLSDDLPVLRMNNVTTSGRMDLRDLKYLPLGATKEQHLVREGDILFNRTNSPELVGKTAVYRGPEPMAYAGYLIRLRPNSENTAEYISSYLNSQYGKLVLRNMCKSIIGMANINAKELRAISLPKPPLQLQKDFVGRLRKIDEMRAKYQAHLSHLDELFASVQQRAFDGTLWDDSDIAS